MLLFSANALFAQNAHSVSDINVKSNGSEVILTWRDHPESSAVKYRIIRHYGEITQNNQPKAKVLKDVAPGIETYTDNPPGGRQWWYAIISVVDNRTYDVLKEWRNYFPLPVIVKSKSNVNIDIAKFLDFEVKKNDSEIEISYRVDKGDREIIVFRSLRFISKPEILDYAQVIGRSVGASGIYTDVPISGIPFYYAAVDAELFDYAYVQMLDYAALSSAIVITYDENREIPASRPTPLPQLRLSGKMPDGSYLPEANVSIPPRRSISIEAEQIIQSILTPIRIEPPETLSPHILSVDHGSSKNRRQEALRQIILQGSFAQKDWKKASEELFALSSSNGIDAEMKSRIHYYLGQAYYYRENFRKAMSSFSLASAEYYNESRRWIVSIFYEMESTS